MTDNKISGNGTFSGNGAFASGGGGGGGGTSYTLTVQHSSNGTTSPSEGTYGYSSGYNVYMHSTPASGYEVDYWVVDSNNIGADSPIITMNTNHSVYCVFKLAPVTHWITLYNDGNGGYGEIYIDGVLIDYNIPTSLIEGDHDITVNWYWGTFQYWECHDGCSVNPTDNLTTTLTISSDGYIYMITSY